MASPEGSCAVKGEEAVHRAAKNVACSAVEYGSGSASVIATATTSRWDTSWGAPWLLGRTLGAWRGADRIVTDGRAGR